MAQIEKLERQVELKCSADKIFEKLTRNQEHIPNICPNLIQEIQAHQSDWISVGTTRKWDFLIDGEVEWVVERIEVLDTKNKIIERSIIDGGMMKTHYKTLTGKMQAVPKDGDDGSCIVKVSIEYEKLHDAAPLPLPLLNVGLDVFKSLGSHLAMD